jgi:hypothetical protein
MTSAVIHVVTVVGLLIFISFFNVSYAKSIKMSEYINSYYNKHNEVIINVFTSRHLTLMHYANLCAVCSYRLL